MEQRFVVVHRGPAHAQATPRSSVGGMVSDLASGLCDILDSPEKRRVSLSAHGSSNSAPPSAAVAPLPPLPTPLPLATPMCAEVRSANRGAAAAAGAAEESAKKKKRPRRDDEEQPKLEDDAADGIAAAQMRIHDLEAQLAAERTAREKAEEQAERLKRLYFAAICVAVKLDTKRAGGDSEAAADGLNRDAQHLWEIAWREGVQPESYPSWVSGRL